MTKKPQTPEPLNDADLDNVQGGLYSTYGMGTELKADLSAKGYYDGAGNHITRKTSRKDFIGETEKNVVGEGAAATSRVRHAPPPKALCCSLMRPTPWSNRPTQSAAHARSSPQAAATISECL